MASKSKLLVRSHAIQESASPPPSPLKQEIKESENESVDQKSNHDIHVTNLNSNNNNNNIKKDEETQNNAKSNNNRESNNKKYSGAIQKSVNIKETGKYEKINLNTMGSSSSVEGPSSGFISRESSYEQHVTDHNGISLLQFFHETLNKNAKDRNMLLKIEKELYSLATDKGRTQVIFPPMCSYNRMLIHRVAAYFGMDHNVDATQQCVIAGVTSMTKVPDVRFKTLINDAHGEEYKKSILKRGAHSFDECKQTELLSANKGSFNRKTKSFEERQHNYDKIKHRIFKDSGNISMEGEWSRSSSIVQDEAQYKNSETKTSLPDYQCHVLEILKNKRNEALTNEGLDRGANENPCKYGALWAVTDINLVPKGSILIDPQTLKPIVNSDNTIYTYDPNNFPPNLNKYEGPIVKLNDVKININDEEVRNEGSASRIANNAPNCWNHNVSFRVPPQEFGVPLFTHGPYITNNPRKFSFKIEEKAVDITNLCVDPRFQVCSYSQGMLPPELNQITKTSPDLRIIEKVNNSPITSYSSSSTNFNNEGIVMLPSNCVAPQNQQQYELVDIENKRENPAFVDQARLILKNSTYHLEKNVNVKKVNSGPRYKFINSIQPHSTNLQTSSYYNLHYQDGEQHRILHTSLGPHYQQAPGHQRKK